LQRWVALREFHLYPAGYNAEMRPVRFLGDSLKSLSPTIQADARRAEAVYVLHAFHKKTQATPKKDLDIAKKAFRAAFGRTDMSKPDSYQSVWDAIADTPEQTANLRTRAELMQKIAALLKEHDWTQAEAASRCGVTQPRINDLLRGRVSRFSLDALVNIATSLGCRVRFDLDAA
jgi:predicted XRE-type DNA-binding protein